MATWGLGLRMDPFIKGASGGEFRRGESMGGAVFGLQGDGLRVYTRSMTCNLLRPLIKILFLLVPYGYIIILIIIKRIPKEMTVTGLCKACSCGTHSLVSPMRHSSCSTLPCSFPS